MKAEQLSDALNDLDDGIIEETGKLREARKRRGGSWKRWAAAAAACLCVAAAVPAALAVLERLGRGAPSPEPPRTCPRRPRPSPAPTAGVFGRRVWLRGHHAL